MSTPYTFRQGTVPVLVSFPHSSTFIPPDIKEGYTETGKKTPDTDWFLPELYQIDNQESPFSDVSVIQAGFSRFVIDPNRPTDGTNLYPGKPTPELCPTKCFDGSAVYLEGHEPDKEEISRRTTQYWEPYHNKIEEELIRLREKFGVAVLFDAHSILSAVPRLFEGTLPNFNMGTANRTTAAAELHDEVERVLNSQTDYSFVFNGRFIGGYITRNFGNPRSNIHSIQLELTQKSYMDEEEGVLVDSKVNHVRPVIFDMIRAIIQWAVGQSAAKES